MRFLRTLQARSFRGRVHSVFERVVNIEHAAGELFTLASREIDNAPNTAVLDVADFRTSGIAVDEAVTSVDGELHLGHRVAVVMSAASVWEHGLPAYAGANASLPTQLRLARAYLDRHGARGGMVANSGEGNAFALEVSAELAQRMA